ncbi:MAG: tRNA (cytidine(56)-2'-O)-methyltransferase [Thaumarchaeota archaeon]|nr:tRNA (cytidine(56)-2'-O)-methyltransferase [Nitrososphaerota archaeon]MCL5319076.1 tRNA (cytidine(56)-2'-O)-methyltransferase [Nitrososphaerota archaeon]
MDERTVHVLRIGHRIVRDDRMTTHICLVARAFGAKKAYLYDADPKIKESIEAVNKRWGGRFEVQVVDEWRRIVREWRSKGGIVVHLTMYGMELDEAVQEVDNSKGNILVVVGAEKVPREMYDLSDFNVSVGNQPHSEVAALAVFLDRLFKGKEFKQRFVYTKYKVVPSRKGKRVITE